METESLLHKIDSFESLYYQPGVKGKNLIFKINDRRRIMGKGKRQILSSKR